MLLGTVTVRGDNPPRIRYTDFDLPQPDYIFTPYGKLGSPAAKYQWTIGINALISSCALFSVAISTILLRNSFSRAVSSLEAIDTGLTTKLGSTFAQLVSPGFVQHKAPAEHWYPHSMAYVP